MRLKYAHRYTSSLPNHTFDRFAELRLLLLTTKIKSSEIVNQIETRCESN